MKTDISTLRENAKRFGVNLTHVVNGKRVVKTRSRLSKDVRKKDKAEWKKLVKRLRKFQDKLEPVIERATNYNNTWLNNLENTRQLNSKLITKGIELWQNIVSYFDKRGTRVETYSNEPRHRRVGPTRSRRGQRAPTPHFRATINRFYGNFNNVNGVNLNVRSALGGFFTDLNSMGPREFRVHYQIKNTPKPKNEFPNLLGESLKKRAKKYGVKLMRETWNSNKKNIVKVRKTRTQIQNEIAKVRARRLLRAATRASAKKYYDRTVGQLNGPMRRRLAF
jgi:hypothetical protein